MNKVTIITHLPFRKKGNQSLKRFVEMFLNRGIEVVLITDGQDSLGENSIVNRQLKLISLRKKEVSKISSKKSNPIDFEEVQSEQELLPYIDKNIFIGVIKKQVDFIRNCIKQYGLIQNINHAHLDDIKGSDLIIGYEASRTFVAKNISKKLNIPFVNKFQGTILAVCKRSLLRAILLYPKLYFGLNKSDLCLMVNDGTDGRFWAKKRGNENIRFRPHGVAEADYENLKIDKETSTKLKVFNNASSSDWKRPDRVIRALASLSHLDREKIHFTTTFFGPNKPSLIKYVEANDLSNCVTFLNDCDHIESNMHIRSSSLLIMTNDMSNLGNPILESIFYNTPFITIDDNSLSGICDENSGGMFVKLTNGFDEELGQLLVKIATDRTILDVKSKELEVNFNIKSLLLEQADEYEKISELIRNK